MKKIFSIIIFSCLSFFSFAQAPADSTKMTADDIKLILGTFDGAMVKNLIPRADMLVNTAKDSAQAAFIAEAIYDYYHDSKIMGYDEIAIHIVDEYFLNGKLTLADQDKLMAMKMYAHANRNSLIGLPAQELLLPNMQGENISLLNCHGDYKLLLFYEDECASCKRQIPLLMKYLSTYTGKKLTFYRVYTQNNREKWVEWVADMEKNYTLSPKVTVYDVWDPDYKSDFVNKYGVVSTPQMFLISRHNIIIGRGLTPKAVGEVIDVYDSFPGKFDSVFNPVFLPLVSSKDVDMTKIHDAVDMFYYDSKDNLDFFHESMFSLFQYLKKQEDYHLQKGAAYLAEKYIVAMPDMWSGVTFIDEGETNGSSLLADYGTVKEFIDATAESVRRFNLNPLEEKVTDLALTTPDGKKASLLAGGAANNVLFFYSTDCAACEASMADMKRLAEEYKDADVSFTAIYTGTDKEWPLTLSQTNPKWRELWDRKGKSGMFKKYDLDGLPRIYFLDKDYKAIGKDLNPATVEAILKALLPKAE